MNAELSLLREYAVRIPCSGVEVRGDLAIPAGARGLVVFAHGSGSSRLSPRNRLVADHMHHHRLATLLLDLLTSGEAVSELESRKLRFNIRFLTNRLLAAIKWAGREASVDNLGIGLFGDSTGAAAALCAAARVPEVQAVVSRGGRTDLAGNEITRVSAPTLLMVGEMDTACMRWNEESFARLPGIKHLASICGATHLFTEPHALDEVSEKAAIWFEHYLTNIRVEGEACL